MKGLVLKMENGKAYIMCNDGSFMTIPASSKYQVGQTLSVKKQNIVTRYRKQIVSVAAACLIFLIGTLYLWQNPVAYIDVTVNPKVELTLNCFERIISVEGLNEDGKELLDQISLLGSTVDNAYLNLLALLNRKGYLSKTDAAIRIDVSHGKTDQMENLENLLAGLTAGFLEEHQLHCEFHTHTGGVSRHRNHHGESSNYENLPESNSADIISDHHEPECDDDSSEREKRGCKH